MQSRAEQPVQSGLWEPEMAAAGGEEGRER
eukprot:COSAG03_NODE_388_length_8306_cov_11.912270_10_plen_30_part_00